MSVAQAPSLGSMPEVKSLFSRALSALLAEIPAERAVICYGERQDVDLKPRIGYGLKLANFWMDAPLSLSLLRRVRQDGSPVVEGAVSEDSDSLSVVLSGARSLLCVPFWGPNVGEVCGLLYCDTTSPYKPFTRDHFHHAVRLARTLEEQLREVRGLPSVMARSEPRARVVAAAPPAARPRSAEVAPPRMAAPSALAQAVFFRSLSVLFDSGIPLARSLSVLGTQSEDPRMSAVAEELHRQVVRGHALSHAMDSTGAFTNFQVRMVAVAEKSGRLHTVLQHVADYQEVVQRDRVRLKSALTYPALVMTLCLLALIVLPGYLMAGQFQLLRELKVPLPWVTRVLGLLSDFVRHPLGLAAVACGVGGLVTSVRAALRRPGARLGLLRLPVVGKIVKCQSLSQFALSLSMQMGAGILANDALVAAGAATTHPILQEVGRQAARNLVEGADLTTSLAATGFFPRVFLEMVRVGEETGQVEEILMWISRVYQEDLEAALERLAAVLEPLVMLVLGVVTAVVMLATMLPMVKALEVL